MLQITKENFQKVLDTDKPVLIDFFADWCTPCKAMMPHLEELALEDHGVVICKADVDANDHLCHHLRISTVPTVVLFNRGKEVARTGLSNKKDLLEMMSQVLLTC